MFLLSRYVTYKVRCSHKTRFLLVASGYGVLLHDGISAHLDRLSRIVVVRRFEMPLGGVGLSRCIATKNSAEYIDKLLRVGRSFADEVVVAVDASSNDHTERGLLRERRQGL